MNKKEISKVFFATDLPVFGEVTSQTFLYTSVQMWSAFNLLMEKLNPYMFKPQPGMDAGLHAITDAVLLSEAETIFAQGPDCGKSSSSFLRLLKLNSDAEVLYF